MSALRYGTGRGRFVGQSLIYPLPIPLDPAAYFGAAVVGADGQFYYSNGLEWIVPIEDNEILRPSALVPFSVDQRTQLRLTTFRSPAGLEQTGIIFEISTNGADFDGALTRIVSGFGNTYQIAFPEDGFGPGDRVLWRAAYTGTSGAQSSFSVPYAQTFPELISQPSPLTRENAITGTVRVTDFESAAIFGYGYAETQTEFYAADATPGTDAPLITITQTGGAITTVPIPPLEPATDYLWRTYKLDSGWADLSAAEVTAVAQAVSGHVKACFRAERAVAVQLDAMDDPESADVGALFQAAYDMEVAQ